MIQINEFFIATYYRFMIFGLFKLTLFRPIYLKELNEILELFEMRKE